MFDLDPIAETQTVEKTKPELGAGMKFCPQCSNMLYPKAPEEKGSKQLIFECKRCGHTETSSDTCIYVNVLKHDNDTSYSSKKNITADPCLRRGKFYCPYCHKTVYCVFYLDEALAGGDSMKEFCECTENPSHVWQKDKTDEIRKIFEDSMISNDNFY